MKRYFIPRNSRLYSMIAHMSWYMRYLFSLLFLLIIGCSWYVLIYRSFERYIISEQKRLDCAHNTLQSFHQIHEKKECLDATYTAMKRQFFVSDTNSLHEQWLTQVMQILESLNAAHLKLNSYTIQPPQEFSQGMLYRIHVAMKGTLVEYASWMQALALMHAPLSVSRCLVTLEHEDSYIIGVDMKCALYNQHSTKKDPST